MGDSSQRRTRSIAKVDCNPRPVSGQGDRPPRERRRTDRRGVRGRRSADQDFACYSAPFVAHCLNQYSGDAEEPVGSGDSAARLAYREAKRRRR